MLSYDGPPKVEPLVCGQCSTLHEKSTGFVLNDGNAFAVYWAWAYPHEREVYVSMVIGSWVEPDYSDHVTFSCRLGAIDGHDQPMCSLVPSADSPLGDGAFLGHRLSRDEGLEHPWCETFWNVLDWLVFNDPILIAYADQV